MAKNKENIDMNRLRSYSSVFSRSVFSDILSYSDFSQLDWLNGKYGEKLPEGCSYVSVRILAHIEFCVHENCLYLCSEFNFNSLQNGYILNSATL